MVYLIKKHKAVHDKTPFFLFIICSLSSGVSYCAAFLK